MNKHKEIIVEAEDVEYFRQKSERHPENAKYKQQYEAVKDAIVVYVLGHEDRIATTEDIATGIEPTSEEILAYQAETGENWYNAREELREKAYGGKPPFGGSWGNFWKNY
ncbi:MAG: hypothetical protein JWP44_4397 [Mucilaginibacter sp.]|nr:hypothetical protein [Mucilaginibacter sp.]